MDRSYLARHGARTFAALGIVFSLALAGCSGSNSANASGSSQDSGAGGAATGTGESPANGRHRMAEALASLGLSDAQKDQIREIMSDARKSSANADPMTRRANYRAAIAKIDTVLTPDQRTKLHAKIAQMRSRQS